MLSYRKDGSTFWDALTLAPVEGPDGRVTHFVGVVTDITGPKRDDERLRESEERLRLMIESVRDYAIFSIDLEGRVSSWNSGAERLFGFAESEILGREADLLFTPEDRRRRDPPAGTVPGRGDRPGRRRALAPPPGRLAVLRQRDGHGGPRRGRDPPGLHQGRPRHHRVEAGRGRAARRQGGRRGRQPGQELVPGQHEPRAADPAQRHHRLQRDARRGGRATAGWTTSSPTSSGSTRPASTCSG